MHLLVSPERSAAAAPPDVFCPQCGYALHPWEVHLLKLLECPDCASKLELGLSIEFDLPLVH